MAKILRRLLMLLLAFAWHQLAPDWEMRAGQSSYMTQKLTYHWMFLLIEGFLAYGFVWDMCQKEKLLWAVGLIAFCVVLMILSFVTKDTLAMYLMVYGICEVPVIFIGGFLWADWFVHRKKQT